MFFLQDKKSAMDTVLAPINANVTMVPPGSKMRYFWSNPYRIEVIITSVTEMLELPNFGHMTTFTL